MEKARKRSRLSKADIEEMANILDKFGEIVIGIGKLEQKLGPMEKLWEKIGKFDLNKLLTTLQREEPELASRFMGLMVRVFVITPRLEKPSELSPDEKVSVGNEIKEIAKIVREISEQV